MQMIAIRSTTSCFAFPAMGRRRSPLENTYHTRVLCATSFGFETVVLLFTAYYLTRADLWRFLIWVISAHSVVCEE